MMPKQSINFVNLCQKGRYCKLSYIKEKLLDDSLTPSNLRHHRESYTKKSDVPSHSRKPDFTHFTPVWFAVS